MIDFLNWLDGILWGLPLIVLMIVTGLYFTVRSGFFRRPADSACCTGSRNSAGKATGTYAGA